MKKLMMVAAASVAAWCSWGAESISVDKVANHYPWDGKVDCVCTLGGVETSYKYKGVFQLSVERNGETVHRVVTNELGKVDGIYTNTFDCTVLFGAGFYPNGGISVALVKELDLGGVQLWEHGPYFAECNVGASKPEEKGYYFWWGDTVGYTNVSVSKKWYAVDGSATDFSFDNTNEKIVTRNMTDSQLKDSGYIDSSGNLAAEYDAATAHLGAPWRLPTDADLLKLIDTSYCTWVRTENWNGTGVAGLVVTGAQPGYTDKSIFLPVTGYGSYTIIQGPTWGYYCSSTPMTIEYAQLYMNGQIFFNSTDFGHTTFHRYVGWPVRPVRSAE